MPPGLSLDSNNSRIYGRVPDVDGLYSFTVRATNEDDKYADAVFRIEIIGMVKYARPVKKVFSHYDWLSWFHLRSRPKCVHGKGENSHCLRIIFCNVSFSSRVVVKPNLELTLFNSGYGLHSKAVHLPLLDRLLFFFFSICLM